MREIETSITALLSECPSFKSMKGYWSDRGTKIHEDMSEFGNVDEIASMIEKAINTKVSRIIDIEGYNLPKDSPYTVVSQLDHRKGKLAYALRTVVDGHAVVVSGVPDLLLELADGRLCVVDHKSGGKIHDYRQLSAYALMASRAFGSTFGAVLAYIHHDMEDKTGAPIVRTKYMNNSELEQAFDMIEALINRKLSLSLKFTPGCRYCSHKSVCPEVMLAGYSKPEGMEFNDKVAWYLDNRGRVSIASSVVDDMKDEILAAHDMGEPMPDFAKVKESKRTEYDIEKLQSSFPHVTWVGQKPLGVTEIRKLAKSLDINLEPYSIQSMHGRKIEEA